MTSQFKPKTQHDLNEYVQRWYDDIVLSQEKVFEYRERIKKAEKLIHQAIEIGPALIYRENAAGEEKPTLVHRHTKRFRKLNKASLAEEVGVTSSELNIRGAVELAEKKALTTKMMGDHMEFGEELVTRYAIAKKPQIVEYGADTLFQVMDDDVEESEPLDDGELVDEWLNG